MYFGRSESCLHIGTMSFFQKHIAVNRAIASLLILVCFVFPNTSFAWGYGPGTAPQPKILYLDDEKKFLDEFHAKKKDILFNDNLKWRETSEGSYVLDLPDTTNPMGEKIPVRFVMVPQKKENRFWNLYAQEKKNNQWEYKYKGSPLGYLENFESREPTFVSYLTSSNIQSALDKLKITYQENRSVEVAMTPEMIIENFPSAAAGVACEDLIAQQFDKDKYGMVATVYDALPKEMATKVREYKNYEGFKRGVAGTPNVNPNGSVLGPKKHTPFDDAKVELARIARDEAFKTSLAGTIAFQHRFYGKLDEKSWTKVLTNTTNVSEDTASNPKYQKLLQENLSKIIPLTQPTMTVDEKLKLIAEFNDLHKSINASCKQANAEYVKSDASTGTILHGEKPYTASDRQVMNFNQKNRDARAALESKYKNQFTPQIKKLLATNQLGFLFGSEKFQERVGTFSAEDCFKSGNSGLKEGISLADVYVGQLDSMKNNFAALDDRMEEYQSDQYMDILQRYVASYPLLMKNINSRLTSSYKDTQMLRLSCMAVDSIYEDEKMERFIDYGFMGVALIAGALTVGAGTAAVLSVMGGVTAVEATEAGLDWYGGYQLQMHGRKGLLSGNNTVNGALSVVDRGKALVTQAKWDFALTIVSYGVGDVLAEGYKASKVNKAFSATKKTTTDVVEQTATVESKIAPKPETKVVELAPERAVTPERQVVMNAAAGTKPNSIPVKLYDSSGVKLKNYRELMKQVFDGGTLAFSNGKTFKVKKLFNFGGGNYIFELEDGKLLRVPMDKSLAEAYSLESYVTEHAFLKNKGVRLPEVYEVSSKFEYLVYEKIESPYGFKNLHDFLIRKSEFSQEIQKKVESAMLDFARETANIKYLEDLTPLQLVMSKDGRFVLVDVSPGTKMYDGLTDQNIFDVLFKYQDEVDEDFYLILKNEVDLTRGKAPQVSSSVPMKESRAVEDIVPQRAPNSISAVTIKTNTEFVQAEQVIESQLGKKYKLLNINDEDVLVINPNGELQNAVIYKGKIELENIVTNKKIGNIVWAKDGDLVVKNVTLQDGVTLQVINKTNLIQVSFADGTKIVTKYDETIHQYLSQFMTSTHDEGFKIAEGFVFRSDDSIILIQADGSVLKGARAGSDITFSNSDHVIHLNVADHKIFEVESQRWGNPHTWQRITMEGETKDVSEFDLPNYKDDGLTSGYGDINCSGLAFSGDAWLSKRSPLSCAMPDIGFSDMVRKDATIEELVGKSPTVTPQNAATHFGSTHEIFNDYVDVHSRLMKMPEGGTALIYVKDFGGSAHVFNARKEGGKVVYYDFQIRSVSTDPKAQFFNNNTNKIEIVETTLYHLTTP